MYQWLRKIDGFRSLPKELTEATVYGGWFSIASMIVITLLFVSELMDFITPREQTLIKMQQFKSENLYIHYDVTMFAIDCDHTNLLVFDAFREAEMEIKSSLMKKTPVSTDGTLMHSQSVTTTSEEAAPLAPKFHKTELDWDWDVSSKIISSGISFEEVVQNHDFTFINFYADWCSHCKQFSSVWNEAEEKTDKKEFKDADGKVLTVKMLRMNCVEFSKQCMKLNIRFYPTVRVFKPDGSFVPFDGKREVDALIDFIEGIVGKSHHVDGFQNEVVGKVAGCRMTGSVEILRVPSEFHFQVKAQDKSLVASLTNVSHEVHQMVFADSGIDEWTKLVRRLPNEISQNLNPLAGQKFIAKRNNESPQHFFQVVSTNYYDKLVYQVTAQSHLKEEDHHAIPKAKFSYTISPMTVDISYARKPFYQFLTSVCALLGGAYTIIRVLYGATDFVAKKYKAQVGKLG